MPLRDPTPEELQELQGSNKSTPQPSYTGSVYPGPIRPSGYNYGPEYFDPLALKRVGAQLPEGMRRAREINRLVVGAGLPILGSAIAPIGRGLKFAFGQGIAQGLGGALAEGYDYLTSPPEEQPTFVGSAVRTGINMGIPMLAGGASQLLGPLRETGPTLPARMVPSPPPSLSSRATMATSLETATRQANKVKTAERELKEGLLAQISHMSPDVRVSDIIHNLRKYPAPYNRAGFEKVADELEALANRRGEPFRGLVKLVDLEDFLRATAKDAKGDMAAMKSYRVLRDEVNSLIKESTEHYMGPEQAAQFDQYTKDINARLDVAEGMADAIGIKGKNSPVPLQMFKRISNNPKARQILEAFDYLNGTSFGSEFDNLVRQQAEFESTKAAAQAGNQAAKAAYQRSLDKFKASQEKARLLAGTMLAAPAAMLGFGKFSLLGLLMGFGFGGGIGTIAAKPMAYAAQGLAKIAPFGAALAATQIPDEHPKPPEAEPLEPPR